MDKMTQMIPQYNTIKFTDAYEDVSEFLTDYANVGIPTTITLDNARTLYYLLYARYGNSPIANNDINQFKYKLFSIIFQYGPSWEKKLEIQDKIRNLSEDELMTGTKVINNHAYNPGDMPGTAALEELNYINSQNTQNYKKSKSDAYMTLWTMLATDVSEDFIRRFEVLFKQFVLPEETYIYYDEDKELWM